MKNPNVVISSDFGPIIINVNDQFIGKSISQNGYWAIEDIKFIIQLLEFQIKKLNRNITFYDVGANIGTHSLAIGKHFSNQIKIRAFEAQRIIYNMLCGTIAINGLTNIFCHQLAVSNNDILEIEISLPNYNVLNNFGGLELISPQNSDNQNMTKDGSEIVKVITLDSFNETVDFIKMDIEGMEDKAIEGAKETIDKHRPICFFEIAKTNSEAILVFFKSRKYSAYINSMDAIFVPDEYQLNIDGLSKVF